METQFKMLTKVILEGEFAKVAKQKEWMLDCNSAAEAIQLISVNTGGTIHRWIKQHLNDYKICEVECINENGQSENLVTETFQTERKCKVIRFLPIFTGAGGNGVFQAIAGVAIIVVGAVLCACGYAPAGAPMISAGVGLLISGIVTMMINKSEDDEDSESNYYFNGAVNTTKQGNPVPLVFGRCRVGSAVISSGIDVTES